MALLVKVDATDELVELKKKRQKIYHSIEVHPSFADTGKAYLMGLACTDNPASGHRNDEVLHPERQRQPTGRASLRT